MSLIKKNLITTINKTTTNAHDQAGDGSAAGGVVAWGWKKSWEDSKLSASQSLGRSAQNDDSSGKMTQALPGCHSVLLGSSHITDKRRQWWSWRFHLCKYGYIIQYSKLPINHGVLIQR